MDPIIGISVDVGSIIDLFMKEQGRHIAMPRNNQW